MGISDRQSSRLGPIPQTHPVSGYTVCRRGYMPSSAFIYEYHNGGRNDPHRWRWRNAQNPECE